MNNTIGHHLVIIYNSPRYFGHYICCVAIKCGVARAEQHAAGSGSVGVHFALLVVASAQTGEKLRLAVAGIVDAVACIALIRAIGTTEGQQRDNKIY